MNGKSINSNKIYLGLGSNLSFNGFSSKELLLKAIEEIRLFSKIEKISSFYKSPAWPKGSNSPDYVNCVIELNECIDDPFELLRVILKIENKFGRVRDIENQWAARTIDIDIIDFKSMIINEIKNDLKLALPHPRLHLRDFVILPLQEIASNWINPATNETIYKLLSDFIEINGEFVANRA